MSPVDQIKQKIDIVEFIGQYVQLKKAGRNFKANCPFHQEKSPSFVVSPDRQIWHCFGSCGVGGDVVSFFMKWDNLTFPEALKELAEIAGVQLEGAEYDNRAQNEKEKVIAINNLALKFFIYVLRKTEFGKVPYEYLRNRGLNEKIIDTFEIGYAPASWDSLLNFFKKKNFSEKDVYDSGLIVQSSSGSSYYDRFRNRIMFPIKDHKGVIVGFSGRVLVADQKSAKYVNTPETAVYHKRESLYGIHLTRDAIRKAQNVYIVEGEFDLITPYQHGVEPIVAIKGAALTTEQLSTLKRYTNKITLALDTDAAGIEAMKRGIREAEKQDFDIHVVEFTKGKDPDEAARADIVTFKKDLKNTIPIYDFLLKQFQKKYSGESAFDKKKIAEEMAPFIAHISNPIVYSHYIKKIAHMLDVETGSVERIIFSQKKKEKRSFRSKALAAQAHPKQNPLETMQKVVLSYILQRDNQYALLKKIVLVLSPDDFLVPAYANILKRLTEYLSQNPAYSYPIFIQSVPPEIQSVADELFLNIENDREMPPHHLAKMIYELKRQIYIHYQAKYNTEDDAKVQAYKVRLQGLDQNEIENTLKSV